MDKVNVVWFRRWTEVEKRYETSIQTVTPKDVEPTKENLLRIHDYIQQEFRSATLSFFRLFDDKFWLSHPRDIRHDKIYVLDVAKKKGLHVPPTLITTQKQDLLNFKKKYSRIISKNLNEVQFFISHRKFASTKTIEMTESLIDEIEDNFFPSLFQALIPKDYELRVFYLDGQFYPMAIFSQLDEQTQIDFRNYNFERF